MQYDANHANEKALELLNLIKGLNGKRATDEQLEEASRLCEESNRFFAEWAGTEEGMKAILKFVDEDGEVVQGMLDGSIEASDLLKDNQVSIQKILTYFAKCHQDLDEGLTTKAIRAWQKFFLAHDHMERLMHLAVVS